MVGLCRCLQKICQAALCVVRQRLFGVHNEVGDCEWVGLGSDATIEVGSPVLCQMRLVRLILGQPLYRCGFVAAALDEDQGDGEVSGGTYYGLDLIAAREGAPIQDDGPAWCLVQQVACDLEHDVDTEIILLSGIGHVLRLEEGSAHVVLVKNQGI